MQVKSLLFSFTVNNWLFGIVVPAIVVFIAVVIDLIQAESRQLAISIFYLPCEIIVRKIEIINILLVPAVINQPHGIATIHHLPTESLRVASAPHIIYLPSVALARPGIALKMPNGIITFAITSPAILIEFSGKLTFPCSL